MAKRSPPAPPHLVPTPHAGQEQVLRLAGRYRVAICGRRFGKNVVGGISAVRCCESATLPRRVWWLSPVAEQSLRQEREMARWLCPRAGAARARAPWKWHRAQHSLEHLASGSVIEFLSAFVPDNLRGAGLDLVIIDEAADVSEYTWKMVIKPMLLDHGGEALFLGTPRGTGNWIHRLFLRGQSDRTGVWASIQLPTRANPLLKLADIDAFRADMSDTEFRQEFEAEFVAGADSVFPHIAEAIVPGPLLLTGAPGARYATGIDLGRKKDWTVITTLNLSQRLVAFARFRHLDWGRQIDAIRHHLDRFPGPVAIDATGVGDAIFEAIATTHPLAIPYVFTHQSREHLLDRLAMAFARRTLTLAPVAELRGELEQFTFREDMNGRFRAAAPPGGSDDCVMSLALANWCYDLFPPAPTSFLRRDYDGFGNRVERGFFA